VGRPPKKESEKYKRFEASLYREDLEALKFCSEKQEKPKSWVIRKAIQLYKEKICSKK